MSWRHLLHVVGAVVAATGVAMFAPAVVALIYQEWDVALWVALSAMVTVLAGFLMRRIFDRPGELLTKEGFAAVGLSWFAIAAFGSLPYLLTGSIPSITDAFFETAAGFTTTGASIVPNPEALPHGILFWRGMTQWLGGMGVIVLSIAILPLLGLGAVQLARAESPGPVPDRLTPRFRETAKRLWWVYLILTGVQAVLLVFGDMTLFEAIAHAFTTMSTGGFSTEAESLGAFSAYSQWIVILFMALAGASFSLHYRAPRTPGVYQRSSEFRVYAAILLGAALVMIVGTWGGGIGETIRDGVFTSISIVTTTGYATADFGQWIPALQILIVGLMFVGGMAGSTAGAIKTYRLEVLAQASRMDLRRLIHPRGVFITRIGKKVVPDTIVEAVQTFFLMYMFAFMTGTALLGLIGWVADSHLTIVTTVSAVASSLGNVGPGLEQVGPTQNYLVIPALGKWLLAVLMIVGRLEILPVVLLFTRELWRR